MTTNVASPRKSVNGSSRRQDPRPPKEHVLDLEAWRRRTEQYPFQAERPSRQPAATPLEELDSAPLNDLEIQDLMTHLLRTPQLARTASSVLEPRHFQIGYEMGLRIVCAELLDQMDVIGTKQFRERLTNGVFGRMRNASWKQLDDESIEMVLGPDETGETHGLLAAAFHTDPSELDPAYGLELLQRFLMERDVQALIDQRGEFDTSNPAELSVELSERIEKIRSLGNPDQGMVDCSTFLNAKFNRHWLVEGVLVAGEPCIFGGSKKTMKTSLLVDLAVSLGTGTKFLGEFDAPRRCRIGFISGESGEATLQETLKRVLEARASQCHVDPLIWWQFKLPQLDNDGEMQSLAATIRQHRLQVIIIDPIYLALLSTGSDLQASNMFDMGPLLGRISRMCLDAGATPILVAHSKKGANTKVPELEDLAYSGLQEFARQWLLVGRRKPYEPGSGSHRLWFHVGGSAGFSNRWAVDIDEGTVDKNFAGRYWGVSVRSGQEEREREEKAKGSQVADQRKSKMGDCRRRVRAYLREHRKGDTLTSIRKATGIDGKLLRKVLDGMVRKGVVQRCSVEKRAGTAGTRRHEGFKLARRSKKRSSRTSAA